ncbi:hypothetical protein GCM10009789_83420 [Kribbella sancticallisti]|uniref:Uncharacterized protein n=1 Tax=Kribbella sancticallisti TaxID=460087 RepID=A0ABP4QPU1_9ACTN
MRYDLFVSPWIGHHASRILLTAFAAQVAYTAAELLVGLPSRLAFGLELGWTTTVLHAGLALLLHARGPLCERCIAEMPLDGSARAERYRRNLTTVHWIRTHRWGWIGIAAATIGLLGLARHAGLISEQIEALLYAGPVMWVVLSLARHSQLQPWCPQCRGNGGGDYNDHPIAGPRPSLALSC